MRRSAVRWYFLISCSARTPGRYRRFRRVGAVALVGVVFLGVFCPMGLLCADDGPLEPEERGEPLVLLLPPRPRPRPVPAGIVRVLVVR